MRTRISARKWALALGAGAIWLASVSLPAAPAREQSSSGRKPNIVVLLADDLGHTDVSAFGNRDIPTPNIDSIVRQGVRLQNGYVTAAVCVPSRHGLMSGCYQQRWGQEFNTPTGRKGPAPVNSLPLTQATLGQSLKAADYATGAIGKWHLGFQPEYRPNARGFDEFFGMPAGRSYIDIKKPGVHYIPELNVDGEGRAGGLTRNGQPVVVEDYLTEVLGREGADFIERRKAHSFFLYLAFNAPHVPLQVTRKYYDRFPHIQNETKRVYAGMVSALDTAVGVVLAKLRQTGLEKNTLVIFLSDNGAPDYVDVDHARNYPLKGHKRTLYDGGIHVPFAMQWPGRLPAGKNFVAPVISLDIFPTVLAAAGVPAEKYHLDGANLLPFLTGKQKGQPHQNLFWRAGPNSVAIRGSWKLIRTDGGTDGGPDGRVDGGRLVRLYDLSKDIHEDHDLSASHPEVVAELTKAIEQWSRGFPDPLRSGRTTVMKGDADRIEWHY